MGTSKYSKLLCSALILIALTFLTPTTKCQKNGTDEPLRPGFPNIAPNSPVIDDNTFTLITIDDIITPSDTCKEIVARFASGISNFTHCSVTNSRPIHLCGWCIADYLGVQKAYHDLFVTIDEKGNPCKEYFTNLDRIEIVAEAYKYVSNLWKKGNCDCKQIIGHWLTWILKNKNADCFEHAANGTLIPEITQDVTDFILLYELTKSCFNAHLDKNNTCIECKQQYEHLNSVYIDVVEKYGDNVCLDLVDTMNTTREVWSEIFHCTPERKIELALIITMSLVLATPVIFYFLTYILSTKQEAKVFHPRRLAFAISSLTSHSSGVSGYLSSRRRSTTVTSRSESTSVKTSEPEPNLSQN